MPPGSDLPALFMALETARVTDFVRYVERQMLADPKYADVPFRDGWRLMVGAYAAMSTAATEYAEVH